METQTTETKRQTVIYLSRELRIRLDHYISDKYEIRNARTEVIVKAIEEFLTKEGY